MKPILRTTAIAALLISCAAAQEAKWTSIFNGKDLDGWTPKIRGLALGRVLAQAGIVVTTPDLREVRDAGASAFATVAWRQEDGAGEALHEFTCHYMLVDQNGAWRIATVVNAAEPD